MNEVEQKIEAILAKKLKTDKIDPDKELRALGLDSLDIVEMCLEVEDELHVEITSEELKNLKKVQDLYTAIGAKVKPNK